MLGTLWASGWGLEESLELTLPQLELVARSIVMHKAKMIDAVISPIAQGLGAKYKPGKTSRRPRSREPTREQKDLLRLAKLNQLGIRVHEG